MVDYSTWSNPSLRKRRLAIQDEIKDTEGRLIKANPTGAYFSNTVTYCMKLEGELFSINDILSNKARR
jgi:hypothetical protein